MILRLYLSTCFSLQPYLNVTFIRPIWIIFPEDYLDYFDPHFGNLSFPFLLDIHLRLLPGFHNFTDMAWTANILLISCGILFLAMYQ